MFLYGMHTLSTGLEKAAGSRLKKTLESMTSSFFKSLLLGMGVTMAIQSSSAVTVVVVGFVNSGIMELSQSVGIIMGTNIGTTITAWILSLVGIESNNVFVNLLKPSSFAPVMAFVGILMIMVCKSKKKKTVGEILIGFAVLIFGMQMMSDAVQPLADMPEFANALTYFNNPILGVLTGMIFTAIIQSSSASVGILQALSLTGSITFGAAFPIIMGQNIGTCVTSLLSSIGASKNAKRVAAIHISFNVIGTILFLIVIYSINAVWPISMLDKYATPFSVAVIHSIFNIVTTVVLLPFNRFLIKIARLVVRDSKDEHSKEGDFDLIDERLLRTPSIAVAESKKVVSRMFEISRKTVVMAIELLSNYTVEKERKILDNEDLIDTYEDRLGTYLTQLNTDLSVEDRSRVAQLLRAIGDLERISDHACNIAESASEMHDKKISFSDFAKEDLAVIANAVIDALEQSELAFNTESIEISEAVSALEETIDELKDRIFARHIERLQKGICTIELGFIISNILTNYERVADHCSNLVTGVVKVNSDNIQLDYHGYTRHLKTSRHSQFEKAVDSYSKKYSLSKTTY